LNLTCAVIVFLLPPFTCGCCCADYCICARKLKSLLSSAPVGSLALTARHRALARAVNLDGVVGFFFAPICAVNYLKLKTPKLNAAKARFQYH
jgi:hypothetical protein